MQLDSYVLVPNLQPQFAAFVAISAAARHAIPASGDHLLTVRVGGGLQAERAISDFLREPLIAEGKVSYERSGDTLELLCSTAADLRELAAFFDIEDEVVVPAVTETLLIEDVSFDYANQLNRSRRGMLVVPGNSVLFIVCESAPLAGVLANQLEADHPGIALVNIDARSGTVILKGEVDSLAAVQGSLKA